LEEIPVEEIEFSNCSFADDVGRLFFWRGRLFRAIRPHKVEHVKSLFESGLIAALVKENLFPKSWITDYSVEDFPLVVEHEIVVPVTFSCEWCFSMLKDAAVAVLRTNDIAQRYGYQLKDCHGYNVLFDRLVPVFVDLGSFGPIQKCENWMAYEQFVRCYYYPLKIWSSGDSYVGRMSLFMEHGIMPHSSYYSYRFYIPLIRNVRSVLERMLRLYFRYLRLGLSSLEKRKTRLSKYLYNIAVLLCSKGLIPHKRLNMDALRRKVERIKRPRYASAWADYHAAWFAPNGKIKKESERFARIIDIVNLYPDIESVVDIGSNQGVFSTLLLEKTKVKRVSCLDYDECAVDEMYLRFRNRSKKVNAVALQNIVIPVTTKDIPHPNVRFMSDAIIALALTHHLILAQGISIERVFETMSSYSKKYVFIEFMPLGLYSGENSPAPPAWYDRDWFSKYFVKYFNLILEEDLAKNRVLFFGTKNCNKQ